MTPRRKKALIIVDVQNDFLPNPGSSLGVPGGHQAIPAIEEIAARDDIDALVFTSDWHPANHVSFAEGAPMYEDGSWPPHCVQGTHGAEFDEPMMDRLGELRKTSVVVRKGFEPDKEAYSGFDGAIQTGEGPTDLSQWLKEQRVKEVVVVGLALDYCVKATALDARNTGLITTVPLEATRPVDSITGQRAVAELVSNKVVVV